MIAKLKHRYTPEEYLEFERNAEYKSEYFDGEIFAMAGASERHNLISGNVFAALHAQFRKRPCKVYSNDMRLKVSPTGLYTYPDIAAVCGQAMFDDEYKDILLNPAVIMEVLSKYSEDYDRGEKFKNYQTIESLEEYLLISQEKVHIEHYVRQPNRQWLFSEIDNIRKSVILTSINCKLRLTDIYDKVEI